MGCMLCTTRGREVQHLEGINAGDRDLALHGLGQVGHKVGQQVHLASVWGQQGQAVHIILLQEGPGDSVQSTACCSQETRPEERESRCSLLVSAL